MTRWPGDDRVPRPNLEESTRAGAAKHRGVEHVGRRDSDHVRPVAEEEDEGLGARRRRVQGRPAYSRATALPVSQSVAAFRQHRRCVTMRVHLRTIDDCIFYRVYCMLLLYSID